MGGETYSSCSSNLGSKDSDMGRQRELITIHGAQLYLVDGEESVLMTSGEFSLKMLKQTHSPLAVVIASVGEVQWPIGKDAPVLKVWNRRYTFALPGLVYGLVLPDSTLIAALHHLEAILSEYSTFETHHEIVNAVQFATGRGGDEPWFWTTVAPELETLIARLARKIDSTSSTVASSIVMGGDWAAAGIQHGASMLSREGGRMEYFSQQDSDGGVSPRMMKRMQQARRMSAVAKLMSWTLLKGAISATGHVSKQLGLDVNSVYGSVDNSGKGGSIAVASVDAFAKVVEAVETAGKSLQDVAARAGANIVHDRFGYDAGQAVQDGFSAVSNVISTAWTLNKLGVKMLLRMTAASAAISSRSGEHSRSTASTVTDDRSPSSSTYSSGSMPMAQQQAQQQQLVHPQTLYHELTLSPQQVQRSGSLYITSPTATSTGQHLHTSQLFPTSAEQLKIRSKMQIESPSSVCGGIISPLSQSDIPYQQQKYDWNAQAQERRLFTPQAAWASMPVGFASGRSPYAPYAHVDGRC